MRFFYFCNVLKKLTDRIVDLSLAGEVAHVEMTPYRNDVARQLNHKNEPRHSAVAVLLFPGKVEPECILIQRPEYEGTHSAQVAFPGGKQEPNESLEQTAKRETQEEVGIDPSRIGFIRTMSELYIPPSNFMVTPFLGILDHEPQYILNPREVAEVFSFPISELIELRKIPQTKITLSTGLKLQTPYFHLQHKVVWGATAAILNELRHLLRSI